MLQRPGFPGTERPVGPDIQAVRIFMSGTLFVVATPLGNLDDFSPRAVRTLNQVDLIACEDTRHSAKLLRHFGIRTATISYHEHNEEERSRQLIGRLEEGMEIALISDAGTPLLSDPGFRLVRKCRRHGLPIIPIPGPTAVAAALSVSGLPTDRFFFAGFLPKRLSGAASRLEALSRLDATLVFFLSPHRLTDTLSQLLDGLGNRKAFLIREMTKLYEASYSGTLREILRTLEDEPVSGEYTLVVEGGSVPTASAPLDVVAYVFGLEEMRGLTRKEAIKRAARDLALPKRQIYRMVVEEGEA
ncbi:MAG: 16S rRNA (cytidine(1402)-2'-O)-methyltransferase [Acidobacteriota bacterium]